MVYSYSFFYILCIINLTYSKPNSLQDAISRVTVFMTNDTKIITEDLKKEDKKIINETIHSTVENDTLDALEQKLPTIAKHLKKLDTKYNLKFNLLSQESQNFVIEIEKLIPSHVFEEKENLDKFIKDTFIPKYSRLTHASKIELKQFYNKSNGIQKAAALSGL